jgi:hypothetical protein
VALGKAFAKCKKVFAECHRHSAKHRIPVVTSYNVSMSVTQ